MLVVTSNWDNISFSGATGDPGLIPGSGRSLEKEMATHSSILAWRIPWTEEPGGYSPQGREELDTTERLHSLTLTCE